MLRRGDSASPSNSVAHLASQAKQAFLKTVQTLGREGLERAQDLLAEIDFQAKTGIGDATANVERFILAMAAGK